MSDKVPQLPPVPDLDAEEEDRPLSKLAVTPAKKRTAKEAQRDLRKFEAKYIKASAASGLAGFGHFIKGRGTKESGIGLMAYAGLSAKNSLESCDDLIAQVNDPELKVRLQENKLKLIEAVGKIGKDLSNVTDDERTPPDSGPVVNVFPANTQVNVNGVVQPPEKPVSS